MLHPEALTRRSSKWVFRYMDVNKRILIASCIPSLRSTHKSTPVRIDYLELGKSSFIADHIEHSFRAILQTAIREEVLPETTQRNNENGGVTYDVDLHGDEDTNLDMKEGDILIEGAWRFLTRIQRPTVALVTAILSILLLLIEFWMASRSSNSNTNNSSSTSASTNTNTRSSTSRGISRRSGTVVRREVRRQEFTSYILNTITFLPTNERKVIRFPHEFTMRDAIRQHIKEILGGTGVHFVRHLRISLFNGVLRLPKDLKLKIRVLTIKEEPNVVIEAIKPILDESSFPLDRLSIKVKSSKDKVFQNPILKSSVSLNIEIPEDFNNSWATLLMNLPNPVTRLCGENYPMIEAIKPVWNASRFPLYTISIEVDKKQHPIFASKILESSEYLNIKITKTVNSSWANLLTNLKNPKIHLSGKTISIEDIEKIAKNWIRNPKEIGSIFSMQCDTATRYLNRLKDLGRAVRRHIPKDSKVVVGCTVPMINSTTSELNIYKWKVSNYQEEMAKPNGQPWMIVMEVMPIGTARE